MRYDEFRDQFQEALGAVGLFFPSVDRPAETIDLAGPSRRWQLCVFRSTSQAAEPFHISANIAFDWDPVDAARAYTCEEDLVTSLLGRRQRSVKTASRWTRVDLALRAALPYGSTTPLPEPRIFESWINSVGEELDDLFSEFKERHGRIVAVMGGREEVDIEVRCETEGVLSLKGLSVSGFRMVRLPRLWDDPDRRQSEKGIGEQLVRLARQFEDALGGWTRRIAELARWIRYAPPPPEAKQLEPWFEDEQEDDEGPERIH